MIKCVICSQEVTSKRGLAFHIKKHDIDSIDKYLELYPDEIKYVNPKDESLITCPICGRYNMKQLGQHIVGTHKMTHEEFFSLYPNQKMFVDEISERCSKAQQIGVAQYYINKEADPEKYKSICKDRAKKRIENNPDIGKKISSVLREHGVYERFSDYLKDRWSDPEYREMQSEKCKLQHENGLTEVVMKSLKTGKHPVWIDGNYYLMRSTWEVKFAKFLFSIGVAFDYEPIAIPYEFKSKMKSYFPDFIIKDTNIIFEVKPLNLIKDDRNVAKMNAAISNGYDFRYITEDVLFGTAPLNLSGCYRT